VATNQQTLLNTMEDGAKPFANYAVRDLTGHKKRITTLGWSGDGRKLASGSNDFGIRIWTVEPHAQVSRPERQDVELKGHTSAISHLAWKPGNQCDQLVSTTSGDKSTRLWDVRTSKCVAITNTSSGLYVTWCPDGSSYAVMNSDNTLSVIDVRKAGKIVRSHKFPMEVHEVMWGPAINQIMLATNKGCVDVVSLPHLESMWSLRGHSSTCYCFATNSSHKYLATGGADATVTLWDLDDVVSTRTWAHMDHPVRSLSMSHDSKYLAYASELGEVEVLSIETGERLAELRIRTQFSDSVAWNPRHNVLAYCDEMPDMRERSLTGVVGIYAPSKS